MVLFISDLSGFPALISLREALVVKTAGRSGRTAVHTDAVESQIVSGKWLAPRSGETVQLANGAEQKWEPVSADTNGIIRVAGLRGGYVYWAVPSERDQLLFLEASGHNLVYVNSELRVGDPYSHGYVRVPVCLHAGTNDFLFQCSRGSLQAKLTEVPGPLVIQDADATLPDVIDGESSSLWAAMVLINATMKPERVSLRVLDADSREQSVELPALGLRKVAFSFKPHVSKAATNCHGVLEARIPGYIVRKEFTLRMRRSNETCKRTFLSDIDGSVQYYAVNPPARLATPPGSARISCNSSQGLSMYFSLHGAGVEATGQAASYESKPNGVIICPTNRRPYGFDWEEWGRIDALEVLSLAETRYRPDPTRIYLTGHSMGGHGTWQLGALYPDRFAAIAPSAGWISFFSYADTNQYEATNAIQKLLRRASATSDTLLMASNYVQEGIYILHGDADDNVPVSEARTMRHVLGQFHRDFDFHEQPGAGHWWDASDEPGADCVDFAPLFDFFSHRVIPRDEQLRGIRFTTVNPAVSSRCHWLRIMAQDRCLEPSSVSVRCDPGKRRLMATTTNVAEIWFDLPAISAGAPLTVELDSQSISNIPWPTARGRQIKEEMGIWFSKQNDQWRLTQSPDSLLKNPSRSGPFRQAFAHQMLFVYGTQGTPSENHWALNKARYDAEVFWYRGNGSVQIMTDVAYLEALKKPGSRHRTNSKKDIEPNARERNVILYGHADCNAAWPVLLSASPVQVHRGAVRAETREILGEDLACLFLQPNREDPRLLVGVVCGTGAPGLRLSERLPYFISGAGFPDFMLFGTETLEKGIDGIRAVGFFGRDWSVSQGEFAWRD